MCISLIEYFKKNEENLELGSITIIPEIKGDGEKCEEKLDNNGTIEWALEKAPVLVEKGLKSGSKAVLDELIEIFLPNGGGCTTMLTMSAGYTAFITMLNIYSMVFKGRSKSRALKHIIDEGGAITVGNFVGYGAGITAALLFNSLPTLGVLGVSATVGFVASYFAHSLFDQWTLKIPKLPKDEELEKAHNLLQVKWTDNNSIVNRAYSRKAREFHPDSLTRREPFLSKEEVEKAGKEFLKVQNAMKAIREAREEDGWVWLEKEEFGEENDWFEKGWTDKIWNFLGGFSIHSSGAPTSKSKHESMALNSSERR